MLTTVMSNVLKTERRTIWWDICIRVNWFDQLELRQNQPHK